MGLSEGHSYELHMQPATIWLATYPVTAPLQIGRVLPSGAAWTLKDSVRLSPADVTSLEGCVVPGCTSGSPTYLQNMQVAAVRLQWTVL